MHLVLIFVGFVLFATQAPVRLTALLLVAALVATYAGQTSVRALTGVASSAIEVFRAVGLGLLFVALLWMWQTSFNWHFASSVAVNASVGFLIAYAAGFKIAMGIDMLQACVVAAVTTATSVLLVLALQPLL